MEQQAAVQRNGAGPDDRGAAVPLAIASVASPGAQVRGPQPALPGHSRRGPLLARSGIQVVDLVAVATVAMLTFDGWPTWLLGVVVAIGFFARGEFYALRMTLSALEEAPRVVRSVGGCLLVVSPLVIGIGGGAARAVLLQAALTAMALVVGRALSYAVVRAARRHGRMWDGAIIVGTGTVAHELYRRFSEQPHLGVRPLGFVGQPFLGPPSSDVPPTLLGDVTELNGLVRRHGVSRLIVAFGSEPEAELVQALRASVTQDVAVYVVPRFFDLGAVAIGPDFDDAWGIPLYRLRRAAPRSRAWLIKRPIDILCASVGLLFALPVLAIVAVAVRLSGPGPVLFRQRRIGQHGREFDLLKFRSLSHVPSNLATTSISTNGRGAPASPSAIQDERSRDVERRSTRVGRFLRRTSLDELPQLWNILVGDMSLVGPRPEEDQFVRAFSQSVAGYGERHRLPMGLTGWAQVNGLRGNTSIAERARFDNQYIEHWSLWRDMVILVRTASTMIRSSRPTTTAVGRPTIGDPVVADPTPKREKT